MNICSVVCYTVVAVLLIESVFSPIRDIILAWKYGDYEDLGTSLFSDKRGEDDKGGEDE